MMGLNLALRAQDAGHEVILSIPKDKDRKPSQVGDGLVQKTRNWQDKMRWADLVVMTGNGRWSNDIEPYFKKGFPIFGPNQQCAELELNRVYGQQVLKTCGIETMPYTEFDNYDEAEAFVRKTLKRYVSKPHGDKDRALSYVSKNPADMVYMLQRWKRNRPAQEGFMLQEFVSGVEFAVGGWFGPCGWVGPWCESFEHKKLMAGELGVNCYPPDSEVLTKDGWKFWPDVVETDALCTLKDGKIEFEVPSQLVVGDFSGELIGWQSPMVDILVTPNHNMYVQDSHYRKDFWFEPAAETETKRRVILRGAGSWDGIENDAAWYALLGAYIADGNCHKQSIVFGNCPTHKQAIFIEIAKRAGYEAKMYGRDLYINSGALVERLRPLGTSVEKYVPDEVKKSSVRCIEAFLYGYGSGDGTTRKNNLTYTTVSRLLADDLQELCLKVGWCANIKTRDRRGQSHIVNGYICENKLIAYEVQVSKERLKANLDPEFSYREPYEGKVYCATVTSHVIYVRRNGRACFLGQTGETGTAVKYVKQSLFAEQVLKPLEEVLHALNYVGYIDVACIFDKKGRPRPLEFTARLGWPLFHIQLALHQGDPVKWMADLLQGKDSLITSMDHSIGVVVTLPDFPYSHATRKEVVGVPIYGISKENRDSIQPAMLQKGRVPCMKGDRLTEADLFVSADDYLFIVTGHGKSIKQAQKQAYAVLEEIEIPNSPMWRIDIGDKTEKGIAELQKFNFGQEWRFE